MAAFESVLLVKNEVFVYKIPARTSNRGYRAAEWKLDQPDWTGRLRVVAKDRDVSIKLEDKTTGELFAVCPVPQYPDISVEQVLDSSRYFVIRIEDSNGRKAFIGLGFADRGDSFDLLVALQDHFKWLKREEKQKQENVSAQLDPGPKLDLGFKEGQTIKLNLSKTKMSGENSSLNRPKARNTGGAGGLLPPPPGAYKIAAPSSQPASSQFLNFQSASQSNTQNSSSGVSSQKPANSNLGLLCDLTSPMSQNTQPQLLPSAQVNNDPWGDFTSASSGNQPSSGTSGGGWVSFE